MIDERTWMFTFFFCNGEKCSFNEKIVFFIYLRMNKEEEETKEMMIIIIGGKICTVPRERRYETTACIEGN